MAEGWPKCILKKVKCYVFVDGYTNLIPVDCIVDEARRLFPIEIKSSESVSLDFFTSLAKWNALAQAAAIPLGKSYIMYGGHKSQGSVDWSTIGWKDIGLFVKQIRSEKD